MGVLWDHGPEGLPPAKREHCTIKASMFLSALSLKVDNKNILVIHADFWYLEQKLVAKELVQ